MFAVTCLWCNFDDFKLASYLHTLSSFLFGLILFKVQMVNISQLKGTLHKICKHKFNYDSGVGLLRKMNYDTVLVSLNAKRCEDVMKC